MKGDWKIKLNEKMWGVGAIIRGEEEGKNDKKKEIHKEKEIKRAKRQTRKLYE